MLSEKQLKSSFRATLGRVQFNWRFAFCCLLLLKTLKVSLWTVCACVDFSLCIVSARPQEGSVGNLWLLLCEEHQSWATSLIRSFPKFAMVLTLFSFIVLHYCIISCNTVNHEPKVRRFFWLFFCSMHHRPTTADQIHPHSISSRTFILSRMSHPAVCFSLGLLGVFLFFGEENVLIYAEFKPKGKAYPSLPIIVLERERK